MDGKAPRSIRLLRQSTDTHLAEVLG